MEGTTKRLIKCDNPIFADEIVQKLAEKNIVASVHDELKDPAYGAYGANPGIAVMVFEKDYDRAKEITDAIVIAREEENHWCPFCGSEDITFKGEKQYKFKKSQVIIGILLLVIGFSFIGFLKEYLPIPDDFKAWADGFAVAFVFLGLLTTFPTRVHTNYHCNHCGKDFYRAFVGK